MKVELPAEFLKIRIDGAGDSPSLRCMCPGFELKKWRADALAIHLLDWLPEFALRPEDFRELSVSKVNKMMREAVSRLFLKKVSTGMAEVGELVLHACCRQVCGTFPAVSKIYFKSTANEYVKGFDLVHTKFDADVDKLEIWLGESKFYKDGSAAIAEAISSVSQHLDKGFLAAEKILVGPKISMATPGYEKFQWIFDASTSLDKIFDVMVIPILIAYDSLAASNWQSEDTYSAQLKLEVEALHKKLADSALNKLVVHAFYLPMATKDDLVAAFEKRIQGWMP